MKIVRFSHQGTTSYGLLEGSSIAVLSGSPFEKIEKTGKVVPLDAVRVLAPVAPSKLVCVGLNYTLHAEESGVPVPEEPMLFMCAPSAIIADGEQIQLDNADDRIDFEAEIGIVVGRRARNVAASDAGDYKPVGPVIETDLDPDNVDIKLWQNGELRQSSNTNDMIFPIARILEFVSGIMTLEPGDLIITGTPSGVGPMASGDEIVIEIEKIGRLHSRVA
jgi:2-keto-4-pentenoate hydratase/2-oxohepta-3-ene-1,7-dioic acid hydratase in catechol pathway